MLKNEDCFSCVHNYYETDEQTFCPECCLLPDGEMSNYEQITNADIELFCDELNIQVVNDPDINALISDPVA